MIDKRRYRGYIAMWCFVYALNSVPLRSSHGEPPPIGVAKMRRRRTGRTIHTFYLPGQHQGSTTVH